MKTMKGTATVRESWQIDTRQIITKETVLVLKHIPHLRALVAIVVVLLFHLLGKLKPFLLNSCKDASIEVH
jgi:hypothetical protein